MGLLSALFGGGKASGTKPAKAAPRKAAPPKDKPESSAATAVTASLAPQASAVRGVTELRIAYSAQDRARDHVKAYATAVKLAAIYRAAGVKTLAATYRAAAERHFLARLVQVSRDKRVAVAAALRKRLDVAPAGVAVKAARAVAGADAATLLAAHGVWLKTGK